MYNNLSSTTQCKIITPINSAHHSRIDETTHIQNQRAHFAIGDKGVITPDQVDQLGGDKKIDYYTKYNNKTVSTNFKSKKRAVEDIVKQLFKLQNKKSVKFKLYEKNKKGSETYIAYLSKQSKKYKYRVQIMN